VGPRAGVDRCGNLLSTGIRSPDHPTHSEWLYRLRFPGLTMNDGWWVYLTDPTSFVGGKEEHHSSVAGLEFMTAHR
jgi:hypothetical protein